MERPYFSIVLPEGTAGLAEGALRTLDHAIRKGTTPEFAFDGKPGKVLIVVHRLPAALDGDLLAIERQMAEHRDLATLSLRAAKLDAWHDEVQAR